MSYTSRWGQDDLILGGIASGLSHRGVNIKYTEDGTAFTDGKTVHVPRPSSDISNSDWRVLMGYLDHEVAHVIHTNMDIAPEIERKVVKKTGIDQRAVHMVANMLEDFRINQRVRETWPGSKYNLGALYRMLESKMLRSLDDKSPDAPDLGDTCSGRINALHFRLQGIGRLSCDPAAEAWADKHEALVRKVLDNKKANVASTYDMVERLLADLDAPKGEPPPPPQPQPGQGEPGQQGQGQPSGANGESQGKAGGDGKVNADGGKSDAKQPGDGGGGAQAKSGEGKKSGEGQGGTQPGEGGKGKPGGNDGTGRNADSPTDVGDDWKKPSKASSGGGGDGQAIAGSRMRESFTLAGTPEQAIKQVVENEREEKFTKYGWDRGGDTTAIQSALLMSYDAKVKQWQSSIEYMQKGSGSKAKAEYRKTRVSRFGSDRFIVPQMEKDCPLIMHGRALASSIEDALAVLTRTTTSPDREDGHDLDEDAMAGVAMGLSGRPYVNVTRGMDLDTAVCLVVDASGSMKSRMPVAAGLSIMLARACHQLRIPVELATFCQAGYSQDTCNILMPFDEKFGATAAHLLAYQFLDMNLGASTPGSLGLKHAIESLSKRPERRKIAIIVTDGGFNNLCYPWIASTGHRLCEKLGIEKIWVQLGGHPMIGKVREFAERIARETGMLPADHSAFVKDMLKAFRHQCCVVDWRLASGDKATKGNIAKVAREFCTVLTKELAKSLHALAMKQGIR